MITKDHAFYIPNYDVQRMLKHGIRSYITNSLTLSYSNNSSGYTVTGSMEEIHDLNNFYISTFQITRQERRRLGLD